MIGRVTYAGGAVVATLNARDDWTVTMAGEPAPRLAAAFAALYADSYRGPADGHYGQLILRDLAERTGGTMEIRDFPAAGPTEIP